MSWIEKFEQCVLLDDMLGSILAAENLDLDMPYGQLDGETPLIYVVMANRETWIENLLLLGADLNAKTTEGNTVLHIVSAMGCLDTMKLLLRSGADVNAKDEEGYTALHHVAWRGDLDMFKFLVEAGADMKAKTKRGETVRGQAQEADSYLILQFINQMRKRRWSLWTLMGRGKKEKAL